MIGFAVKIRCPSCTDHCWLADLAVAPGHTVLATLRCRCRQCRGRGNIVFIVRDGHARPLTRVEREAMIREAGKTPTESAS